MKRLMTVLLALILVAGTLAACAKPAPEKTEKKKIRIVTTIAPVYSWVKEIIGENANAECTFLLNSGVDLHNYQPTADDMVTLSECDMFIYVGGESDAWVEDALVNAVNRDMQVVNLMEILGDSAKEEEFVEGMESEEEENGKEEEGPEYDEHVWLSLKNAQIFVSAIADKLTEIDPNGNTYVVNAGVYNAKLAALDAEYERVVKNAKTKTLLFGDRFPFRYLADDYGLTYYAAFIGCSAETEASFKTVSFLAEKVDALKLKYVMTIENSDNKIAETVIMNTKKKNAQILSLDSMQSITADEADGTSDYYTIMENNLSILKRALN